MYGDRSEWRDVCGVGVHGCGVHVCICVGVHVLATSMRLLAAESKSGV